MKRYRLFSYIEVDGKMVRIFGSGREAGLLWHFSYWLTVSIATFGVIGFVLARLGLPSFMP
jgi:hypothetical protein